MGMGRVLYFHHYFPALLYSSMLTAIIVDHLLWRCIAFIPISPSFSENSHQMFYHSILVVYLAGLAYSFHLFSPLAYGMDETPGSLSNSSVHHLKWIDSWEF